MNPLKTLFKKVFDSAPPIDPTADASKEGAAFEWNPEDEAVAPTSATGTSWKRGNIPDDGPRRVHGEATDSDIAASAHNLPTPMFEEHSSSAAEPPATSAKPFWDEAPPARPAVNEGAPFVSLQAADPAPLPLSPRTEPSISQGTRASSDNWVRPSVSELPASLPSPSPMAAVFVQPLVPLSDFEDVYRKAGIKSPVHGYGVERVYRLLTSRRLVGLDRSIRRSALLTALDAAGVPASDVSQDAVLRRKALTAYEAEKALELQSLRSRNESRAEALQDTVETFTRQKQSQIERLAQGSTSAVRAQSDLEIRKRMEQDRLYRSLAYFLEPLPKPSAYPTPRIERDRPAVEIRRSLPEAPRAVETVAAKTDLGRPAVEIRPSPPEAPKAVETVDATIDVSSFMQDEAFVRAITVETLSPASTETAAAEAVTVTPAEDPGADTRPLSQSSLEMALRVAAEEARAAGWGQKAIVEHSAGDAVDALRKLREAKKTDSDS